MSLQKEISVPDIIIEDFFQTLIAKLHFQNNYHMPSREEKQSNSISLYEATITPLCYNIDETIIAFICEIK